jgi:hypothetical protein
VIYLNALRLDKVVTNLATRPGHREGGRSSDHRGTQRHVPCAGHRWVRAPLREPAFTKCARYNEVDPASISAFRAGRVRLSTDGQQRFAETSAETSRCGLLRGARL